jgi:hypothetical protein
MHTRVALTKVIVWDRIDMIDVKDNTAGEVLKLFKEYTATVINGKEKLYPDNTQLIT